jgi:hypothetical protein
VVDSQDCPTADDRALDDLDHHWASLALSSGVTPLL